MKIFSDQFIDNLTRAAKALSAKLDNVSLALPRAAMPDVMIDLESTGTGPDAAILAIGAVAFDRSSNALGPSFYRTIDLHSAVKAGGVIDPGTFTWWMKQSDQARAGMGEGVPITIALLDFAVWLKLQCVQWEDVRVWGNGADFDPVLLSQSYARCQLATPWKFWNTRCFRTIKNEHPAVKVKRTGTHHNALDDAMHQTIHLLKIDRQLRDATMAIA